ncbi:MAG: HTH domain-containing protein [Planctomycetales bacterium]
MAEISRLERLLRLLEALGTGRPMNAVVLAEMCGISRRTIFRDLATLQEAGIHVHYDEQKQGYFLTRPLFLRPADLTLEETLADRDGRGTGGPGIRTGCSAITRTAALKLACNLPEKLRDGVNHITDAISIRIGNTGATAEVAELRPGAAAARRKYRSRIRYDSLFDKRNIETRLSPYRVLFSRREWYVVGRSSIHRAVRTSSSITRSRERRNCWRIATKSLPGSAWTGTSGTPGT